MERLLTAVLTELNNHDALSAATPVMNSIFTLAVEKAVFKLPCLFTIHRMQMKAHFKNFEITSSRLEHMA